MPLGEMLDLEKLALKCREQNRWMFFFSSAPANVPGKFYDPAPCLLGKRTDGCVCRRRELARERSSDLIECSDVKRVRRKYWDSLQQKPVFQAESMEDVLTDL